MYKTVTALASVILLWLVVLTTTAGSALAVDNTWNNNSGNGLWSTSGNWSLSRPCLISEKAKINKIPGPLINEGTAATANWIACGDGGNGAFSMTGGTLTVGTVPGDTWTILGYGASNAGTFTMDGGTVNTVDRMFVGFMGTGTLNMNGGALNIGGMFGIATGGTAAHGYVYLKGGTITTEDFEMATLAGSTALLDISGGVLIIDGNNVVLIDGYINSGKIIFTGTTGYLSVIYDPIADKTTVGMSIDMTKARIPVPANNAVDVMPDANLSWTAGTGAASHNVYFGTSSPGTSRGNQTATTFDPGTLDFNTPYYWRIDEVNGPNTTTGDVWTFRTISGLAKNPDPPNGAMNVALDKVLHWTAGLGIASHDVYLGTDVNAVRDAERLEGDLDGSGRVDYNDLSILIDHWLEDPAGSEPYAGVNYDNIVDFADYALLTNNWMVQGSPFFKGNTTDTSFDPNLVLDTTYYWRVDEINSFENRKGDVWTFTTTAVADDNYTLVGKIMCGYQGWFNAPTDGAGRGWVHWGPGSFSPTNCTVDMWPDMTEMGVDEKFPASDFNDGNNYYVFSPYKRNTVLRHFLWMQQYGIDGVYLQRFATEVTPGSAAFNHRNTVLSHCRDGANIYGRKYAVMYDLSGLGAGETSKVIDDWKYLLDTMRVTRDANDHGYMRHMGKPVVSIWGLGFGRAYEGQESYNLINFLKNDPYYGGNVVMLGVNDTWRTNGDSWFQQTLLLGDIISPWLVGRYSNTSGVNNWATTKGVPDKTWCNNNGKEYLPVMFPGFSWHNLNGGPLNQIPRVGGQFLWDQVYADLVTIDANMVYVAMFDEVDEGTAIFKVSNNPPRPGGVDMFVTYNMDGYTLPSDEYLWLTGQVGRALRGEIPVNQTRPDR